MIDYLDDLESDFSVFHRVDDIYSMDGPDFLRKAIRVTAYQGVMTARVMDEQDTEGTAMAGGERVREVPADRDALASSDAFSGLISWGEN